LHAPSFVTHPARCATGKRYLDALCLPRAGGPFRRSRHRCGVFSGMEAHMTSATLFTRLADRDRALFARCLVDPTASRMRRLFWTVITHLGGVSCSILAA